MWFVYKILLSYYLLSEISAFNSQPEDTRLTIMDVEVEELWTNTVTSIPTTSPATGLDRIAFSWKIFPATLPERRQKEKKTNGNFLKKEALYYL